MRRHHLLLSAQALLVGFAGGAALALHGAPPPAPAQVVVAQAQALSAPAPAPLELAPRADRSRRDPAPAPPAPAPPPDTQPCAADPHTRGERVLATLPPAWQALGMPVAFSGPQDGYYGEVRTDQWVVHIYVRSCRAQSDAHLRHVIAHELGHAHDVSFLSDAAREEYKQARGIPADIPWFGCSGCADLATPAGDYAEVYGQWLRGDTTNKSQLAPDAGPQALADLATRFFSIG